MKTFKTIRDIDIGSDIPDPKIHRERRASRAIIFDKDRNIALLHATNKKFHKLPGGGIKKGENIKQALQREALEEIGCNITNIRELRAIEEYRNAFSLHQISYCFVAELLGEKGTPKMEEDEISAGFEPSWLNIEEAIKTLESEDSIEDYEGKFIHLRDLIFLKEAKLYIASNPISV